MESLVEGIGLGLLIAVVLFVLFSLWAINVMMNGGK